MDQGQLPMQKSPNLDWSMLMASLLQQAKRVHTLDHAHKRRVWLRLVLRTDRFPMCDFQAR